MDDREKLFAENNPVFRLLSLLADLMVLTFRWFVACIPIVTIGAVRLCHETL